MWWSKQDKDNSLNISSCNDNASSEKFKQYKLKCNNKKNNGKVCKMNMAENNDNNSWWRAKSIYEMQYQNQINKDKNQS